MIASQREELFERFVVPELEVLLRVAMSLTAQPADAEDLVQETLLRAYRGITAFDGRHARAWLLTIMRRAELNRHRRRRPDLLDDPDDERQGPDTVDSPEDLVLEREFDAVVETALASLPEPCRHVIELVDVYGLNCAEAAGVLGVTEGTLTSRLYRGRSWIRNRLKAAEVEPE